MNGCTVRESLDPSRGAAVLFFLSHTNLALKNRIYVYIILYNLSRAKHETKYQDVMCKGQKVQIFYRTHPFPDICASSD